MLKNKTMFLLILIILLNLFSIQIFAENLEAENVMYFATGSRRASPEQRAEFLENTPQIVDVKLNSLAIYRITEEQPQSNNSVFLSGIQPVAKGMEVITNRDINRNTQIQSFVTANNITLPSRVDNSERLSFPPIGNQGSLNSCAGWAVGYYMMTNNMNLVRGTNARNGNGTIINANVISPNFIYNLINHGENYGSLIQDALKVASNFGGATVADVPIVTTRSPVANFMSWHPGAARWESALRNKSNTSVLQINQFDPITLTNVKILLANGYVLAFDTDFDVSASGWIWRWSNCTPSRKVVTHTVIPQSLDAHIMTIVGYDDNVWVDINNNRRVDPGESGAFKIANSWGNISTGPHTSGFIWLLYDALWQRSAVPNAPIVQNRIPAFHNNEVFLAQPKVSYTPLLLAEVTINTRARGQLGINIGISPTSTQTPQRRLPVINSGIAFNVPWEVDYFNFTGGTTAASGTFIFDLTPIFGEFWQHMSETGNTTYRFYIEIIDNDSSNNHQQTLQSFRVIDRINNVIRTSTTVPRTANGSTARAWADSVVVPRVGVGNFNLMFDFNNPVRTETMTTANVFVQNVGTNSILGGTNLELLSSDRRNWRLTPPVGGFQRGNYYRFIIEPRVLTDGGNALTNRRIIDFYVP